MARRREGAKEGRGRVGKEGLWREKNE